MDYPTSPCYHESDSGSDASDNSQEPPNVDFDIPFHSIDLLSHLLCDEYDIPSPACVRAGPHKKTARRSNGKYYSIFVNGEWIRLRQSRMYCGYHSDSELTTSDDTCRSMLNLRDLSALEDTLLQSSHVNVEKDFGNQLGFAHFKIPSASSEVTICNRSTDRIDRISEARNNTSHSDYNSYSTTTKTTTTSTTNTANNSSQSQSRRSSSCPSIDWKCIAYRGESADHIYEFSQDSNSIQSERTASGACAVPLTTCKSSVSSPVMVTFAVPEQPLTVADYIADPLAADSIERKDTIKRCSKLPPVSSQTGQKNRRFRGNRSIGMFNTAKGNN